MGFSTLDYIIIAVYLLGVAVAGILIAGRQRSATDFFLGGKALPWWMVGLSIVAGETSALTVISVPGIAYAGSMTFLQLAFGYVVGRVIVSFVFIPAYYRGSIETAYDFLGKRYGLPFRRFTSVVFLFTRVLASGVRLFATAIPIHMITGVSYTGSILIVGLFTLLYTAVGGLKAVVAMDAVQLCMYLIGAVVAYVIILHRLPGGWSDVVAAAAGPGTNKFQVFSMQPLTGWRAFFAAPYTLLGGVVGGAFLSMASHGTDQLLVQRLLSCRSTRESQKALYLDALLIVGQFAFFLLLGLALFAFYRGAALPALGLRSTDEVFPLFIIHELPTGIAGLMVAGILASAMGTLSSSISSLASSAYMDLVKQSRWGKAIPAGKDVRWSRGLSVAAGALLIGGAMLFTDTRNPVVEIGLTIASFTYGGLLGTFLLGVGFPHTDARDAMLGFVAAVVVMITIISCTSIAYTWHGCIGCIVTIAVGNLRPFMAQWQSHAGSLS